jgi:hypothetical protein
MVCSTADCLLQPESNVGRDAALAADDAVELLAGDAEAASGLSDRETEELDGVLDDATGVGSSCASPLPQW